MVVLSPEVLVLQVVNPRVVEELVILVEEPVLRLASTHPLAVVAVAPRTFQDLL
jgi:hypothetical protein